MQLIDSHCHLDDARFDPDRNEVMQRAVDAGVTRFVVPAVSKAGWKKLRGLADSDAAIAPAFGLHPWFCDHHRETDLEQLTGLLEGAVAIGECGLDDGLCHFSIDQQLPWFQYQLRLARERDIPVIVHAYRTVDLVVSEVRRLPGLRGVVHSFAGSQQQAGQLIDLGLHIGIGGAVTFERAKRLQALAAWLPAERLLIETDAPDQLPAAHKGERNEPAFLIEILNRIATLRSMEAEQLAAICNRNARGLFGL